MSDEFDTDGPGTAAYSPAYTPPDGVLVYRTRTSHKASAADMPGSGPVPQDLLPPDPSIGGAMNQTNQLGWSTGFGAFRRHSSFTGRVIARPTMGANPATGPVGYSTRTHRLRDRVLALYTDYTPSSQQVAREVLDGVNDGRN